MTVFLSKIDHLIIRVLIILTSTDNPEPLSNAMTTALYIKLNCKFFPKYFLRLMLRNASRKL